MAEKVIFEFRATRDKDGCAFEFKHGEDHFTLFGPDIWACCPAEGIPGESRVERVKRSRRSRDRVRRRMRETLDLFERMYDDLFGGERLDQSGETGSD